MHPSFNPTHPPPPPHSPFIRCFFLLLSSLFSFSCEDQKKKTKKKTHTPKHPPCAPPPPPPLPSGTSPTDQWSSWHCQWQRQQSCQFHTSSCFRYPATMGKSPARAPWVPTIFFSECPFQKRAGLARRRPGPRRS